MELDHIFVRRKECVCVFFGYNSRETRSYSVLLVPGSIPVTYMSLDALCHWTMPRLSDIVVFLFFVYVI